MTEEIAFGPHRLRLQQSKADLWEGIIVGRAKDRMAAPTRAALLASLQAEAMAGAPGYVGLDGARSRFLQAFPGGFSDPVYLGSGEYGLRGRMTALAEQAQADLPLQRLGAGDAPGAALRLIEAAALAEAPTQARLAEVLRGPKAPRFLAVAAAFAVGSVTKACAALNVDFADEGVNSWVCLTVLPFLWRPEAHMVLRPDSARRFAERIGDPFQFAIDAKPGPATYLAFLQMGQRLRPGLADLGPADNIDILGFMTASDYTNADVKRVGASRG